MSKFKKGDRVVCLERVDTLNGKFVGKGYKGNVAESNSDWPYVVWDKDVGGHDGNYYCDMGYCWAVKETLLEKVNVTLENK